MIKDGQYMRAMRDMIESDGFQMLQQELADQAEVMRLNTLENAADWDTVLLNRGYCQAVALILNWEQWVEQSGDDSATV